MVHEDEQIKTVIIGGACRAGKSRLANLVFQKTRCTVIHLDSFSNTVRNNYLGSEQTLEEAFQQILPNCPGEGYSQHRQGLDLFRWPLSGMVQANVQRSAIRAKAKPETT